MKPSHATPTPEPAPGPLWALPAAVTVIATGLVWDPGAITYGALKAPLFAGGALVAVLAAAWLVHRGRAAWRLDALTSAAGLLVGWALLSVAWTPSPEAGLGDLTLAGAAVAWWLAARVLLDGERAARLAAWAVALTGVGAAGVALWERGQGVGEPGGTVGNPNHLAVYLAAALPALWWATLGAPAPGRRGRLLGWLALGALALPICAALVLSGSRSGLVALGAAAVVALVLGQRQRSRRWWGLVAGALAALLLVAAAAHAPWSGRKSLRGRLYLARITTGMWLDRPLAGHGVGGFAMRFPDAQAKHLVLHRDQRALWTHARTAHCEPLQGLVELGLVGGGLLFSLGLLVLLGTARGRAPPGPRCLAGVATLTVVAVGCLAEGGLHTVGLLALTGVAGALLPPGDAARPPGRLRQSAWVAAALTFTCSAVLIHAGRQYTAERLVGRAHLEEHAGRRVALLQRAVAIAPNPGRARFYLGLAQASQGNHGQALTALRRSRADFRNLGTSLAIGNVLMAQGRWGAASRAYRRAVRLNPRYAAAHHNLGLALSRLGRRAASEASLRRARRLWPGRWLEPWRVRAIRRLIRAADDPS